MLLFDKPTTLNTLFFFHFNRDNIILLYNGASSLTLSIGATKNLPYYKLNTVFQESCMKWKIFCCKLLSFCILRVASLLFTNYITLFIQLNKYMKNMKHSHVEIQYAVPLIKFFLFWAKILSLIHSWYFILLVFFSLLSLLFKCHLWLYNRDKNL